MFNREAPEQNCMPIPFIAEGLDMGTLLRVVMDVHQHALRERHWSDHALDLEQVNEVLARHPDTPDEKLR
jgi:hypothetical protein